ARSRREHGHTPRTWRGFGAAPQRTDHALGRSERPVGNRDQIVDEANAGDARSLLELAFVDRPGEIRRDASPIDDRPCDPEARDAGWTAPRQKHVDRLARIGKALG